MVFGVVVKYRLSGKLSPTCCAERTRAIRHDKRIPPVTSIVTGVRQGCRSLSLDFFEPPNNGLNTRKKDPRLQNGLTQVVFDIIKGCGYVRSMMRSSPVLVPEERYPCSGLKFTPEAYPEATGDDEC